MCGIFSYIGSKYNNDVLIEYANKIIHRGPDSTNYKNVNHVSSDHLNTINYQIESKYCYCLYAK